MSRTVYERDIRQVMNTMGMDYMQARNHCESRNAARKLGRTAQTMQEYREQNPVFEDGPTGQPIYRAGYMQGRGAA